MKTTFVRKATTLQEVLAGADWLRAQHGGTDTDECRVVAERHLSQIEWSEFTAHLMKDREWLRRFSQEHSNENTNVVPMCIRVTGEGSQIALLIDTQGYSYARYVGIDQRTATLRIKTFEEALQEAQKLGFETYAEPHTGITYSIDGTLTRLAKDKASKSPADYILFGRYIVRATQAWDRSAEVYTLD